MLRTPPPLAWLLAGVLLVASAGAGRAAQAAAPLAPGTGGGAPSRRLANVIVKLDAEPVATYRGGVAGLAATSRLATGGARLARTSPAVAAYRTHLARRLGAFESSVVAAVPRARVLHRYDVVVGGVALQLPEDEIARVRALPGVRAVYADERRTLHTSNAGLIGAKAVWGKRGGPAEAGEGIVIGVLDSGIWPEHPSFADPDPSGKAYLAPAGTRACQFGGGANPGAPFACNGKLIGAYRFLDAYDACTDCPHPAEEFSSARDANGHGTHTASTAAGNRAVPADVHGARYGQVAGIAPRAQIIAYKVCGPSQEGGCFASDSVAAIQQAILDGVDVINFSIGGGTEPYLDPVELAFRDAYAAGIFVAASAGNAGPHPDTVEHLGPWVTTVAASTAQRAFRSAAILVAGDGARLKLTGASVSRGVAEQRPVVVAADVGDPFCLDGSADGAFAGAIVVCKRGGGARVGKSFNVARRGAAGMILYNDPADPAQRGVAPDSHFVPTVHLEFDDGQRLLAFAAGHAGVRAALAKAVQVRTQGDVVAAFSARGGAGMTTGVLKPDVAAPGVQILAGDTPEHASAEVPEGGLFQVSEGTSMASPHVAGAAALLARLRPAWTPGQIKSALMTSAAARRVVKEDGVTPFDAFDAGAGRIQVRRALDPGLTFDVPAQDYVDHATDLWSVNQPSVFLPARAPEQVVVTRMPRSELAGQSTWTVTVSAPSDVSIMVPSKLTIDGGGTTTFPIAIDKSAVPPDQARHAVLELSYRSHRVRVPISVVGRSPAPDLVPTSATASTPVTAGGAITLASTIVNSGPGKAGAFYVSFYMSTDAALSGDDVLFAVCDFPLGLAPGASTTCSGTLPFAPVSALAPGSYRVVMLVDSALEVAEADEDNNVLTVAAPVVVQ